MSGCTNSSNVRLVVNVTLRRVFMDSEFCVTSANTVRTPAKSAPTAGSATACTCWTPVSEWLSEGPTEIEMLDRGRICAATPPLRLQYDSALQPRSPKALSTRLLRPSVDTLSDHKSCATRRSTGPPRLRRSSSTEGRWIQKPEMPQ